MIGQRSTLDHSCIAPPALLPAAGMGWSVCSAESAVEFELETLGDSSSTLMMEVDLHTSSCTGVVEETEFIKDTRTINNFRQVNLGPFMSPGCHTSKGVKCLPLILLWKSVVKSRAIQAKKTLCILLHSGLSCLRAYLVHSSSWDGYSVKHLEKLVILQSKYHRMFLFLLWRCFHQPQFSTQAAVLRHSPQLPCPNKRQLVTQRISDVTMYVMVLLGQERNQQLSAYWRIGLLCAQNVWNFCTMKNWFQAARIGNRENRRNRTGVEGSAMFPFPGRTGCPQVWHQSLRTVLASSTFCRG